MDHAGALVGALAAALLLGWAGWSLRGVFLLAIVPGVIAMGVLVFGLRESPRKDGADAVPGGRARPGSGGWKQLDGRLKQFLGLLVLFALANSSDAFLLLKAQEIGIGAAWLPVLWMLLHFSKSLSVLPGGVFSDRFGRKGLLCAGWSLYSVLYFLFGMAESQWQIWVLFGAYGLYYGLTEGVEKAFVADLARDGQSGTAFGWYHGVLGFAVLPAAVLMGWVWDHLGSRNAFFVSAGLSLAASAALVVWIRKQRELLT
jgi:MFS family permease